MGVFIYGTSQSDYRIGQPMPRPLFPPFRKGGKMPENEVGYRAQTWLIKHASENRDFPQFVSIFQFRFICHCTTKFMHVAIDHIKLFSPKYSGYFMYIEASGKPAGYRARLTSSDFKNAGTGGSSPYCLSFFYHMYGSRIGLLRIYVTSLNGQQQALIWSKSGNQGQQWQYGKASFAVSGSFRVRSIFY